MQETDPNDFTADPSSGSASGSAADLPPHLRELRESLLASQGPGASDEERKAKIPIWPDLIPGLLSIAFFASVFGALGIFENLPKMAGIGLTGGAFGAVAGGLAAWGVGLMMVRHSRRQSHRKSKRDASASALIIASDLGRTPSKSGGWVYFVVVAFQFEANGKTWTGKFRVPEGMAHNMMGRHEKVMKENHPGKVVRIHYQQSNPENAGLSRKGSTPWLSLFVYLLVGGPVTGFGVHMLRVGIGLLTG